MHHWAEFAGQIGEIPELPGARCRGRHELFDATVAPLGGDPEITEYARAAALQLCHTCPALTPCRAWFATLKPRQRAGGVTAGQLHERPK